jgi:amino acid transporter
MYHTLGFDHPREPDMFLIASNVPGTPFAEYIFTDSLGRFAGFLACVIQAAFTIGGTTSTGLSAVIHLSSLLGPEYVALTAGEAEVPRTSLPSAFRSVFYRLTAFFVLGALCVGIVVPYSDPNLLNALSNAKQNAGSSPYVIAMKRMRIPVLPHIVNALILTSVFSAGNSYTYCASRALYGLALEGKMPKILARCTRHGVPIYCVFTTLAIACLSFLQVSNNSAVVLQWCVLQVTVLFYPLTKVQVYQLGNSGHIIELCYYIMDILALLLCERRVVE